MKKILIITSFIFLYTILYAQVLRKPIPDKLVVLTFDDAVKSHAVYVAPLLKKYGFRATFFVCEFPPDFNDTAKYMSWKEIQQLAEQGFEIGNHTWHHTHVNKTGKDGLMKEISYIDRQAAALKIQKPITFAYPGYDTYAPAVKTINELGYKLARTGGNKTYDPEKDHPFYIPSFTTLKDNRQQIMDAIASAKDGKITVLTIHGVPDNAHDWVTTPPSLFEEYLKFLYDHNYKVFALKDILPYINTKNAMKLPIPSTLNKN